MVEKHLSSAVDVYPYECLTGKSLVRDSLWSGLCPSQHSNSDTSSGTSSRHSRWWRLAGDMRNTSGRWNTHTQLQLSGKQPSAHTSTAFYVHSNSWQLLMWFFNLVMWNVIFQHGYEYQSFCKDHGALTDTTVWKAICKYHETIFLWGEFDCRRRETNWMQEERWHRRRQITNREENTEIMVVNLNNNTLNS